MRYGRGVAAIQHTLQLLCSALPCVLTERLIAAVHPAMLCLCHCFHLSAACAAAGVCNTPFKPNAAAEACFNDKEACTARMASGLLSAAEKQALGMIKYPPALDRWGRQAFDYADDVSCTVHL